MSKQPELFRRRANRFCVSFSGSGLVPVASELDDKPLFESLPPRRVGDECVIHVEGKRRLAMLLRSHGHVKNGTYLVDRGPYTKVSRG
jgi:hypothetical protein